MFVMRWANYFPMRKNICSVIVLEAKKRMILLQ